MRSTWFFLVVLHFVLLVPMKAQQDSTLTPATKNAIYGNARKASILSAVLPGAGQVYNKKYWKVPIIYAGLGTTTYFFIQNLNEYNYYRTNLRAIHDNDEATVNETPYDSDDLVSLKQSSRNRRDISGAIFVGIYLLNIIDANVDAHLATFDVSDNLSIRVQPLIYQPDIRTGFRIQLCFK